MPKADMFDGHLTVTFADRKMLHFVIEDTIAKALDVSELEKTGGTLYHLASNFASMWGRTVSVIGNVNPDDMNDDAYDFMRWFNQHSGKTDYKAIYQAYLEQCDLPVANEWVGAFTKSELSEIGRVTDTDLLPPDMVDSNTLQDEEVQKKDVTDATESEPS